MRKQRFLNIPVRLSCRSASVLTLFSWRTQIAVTYANPAPEIWDLRKSMAPKLQLEGGHASGVLSGMHTLMFQSGMRRAFFVIFRVLFLPETNVNIPSSIYFSLCDIYCCVAPSALSFLCDLPPDLPFLRDSPPYLLSFLRDLIIHLSRDLFPPVAWCPHDAQMLLTAGDDGRAVYWAPDGTMLHDMPLRYHSNRASI